LCYWVSAISAIIPKKLVNRFLSRSVSVCRRSARFRDNVWEKFGEGSFFSSFNFMKFRFTDHVSIKPEGAAIGRVHLFPVYLLNQLTFLFRIYMGHDRSSSDIKNHIHKSRSVVTVRMV